MPVVRSSIPSLTLLILVGACSEPGTRQTSFLSSDSAVNDFASRYPCLADSLLVLGPLTLGTSTERALHQLGRPVAVTHGSSEDNGGSYEVQTYHYPTLEFDVVRTVVDRISTTSPATTSPIGIRVGQSRNDALARLGGVSVLTRGTPDTLDIPDCGAPSAYLTISFNEDQRVLALELAAERP